MSAEMSGHASKIYVQIDIRASDRRRVASDPDARLCISGGTCVLPKSPICRAPMILNRKSFSIQLALVSA